MQAQLRTTTTTRLLEALLDPAEEAMWFDFDGRYRPIVQALAMRLGLGPEDAADVAQTTMAQFARDYRIGRYERGRGRLRSWLLGIARHRITDALRERGRQRRARGDSAFDELPGEQAMAEIWDAERRTAILDRAMSMLRESTKTDGKTIRAFELVAVEGVPAEVVARDCGLQVAEIYRIKHRITRRLRTLVSELTAAFDEGEA